MIEAYRSRTRSAEVARHGASGRPRGFTLIELMVVVLIMGVLATVGFTSFSSHQQATKVNQAVAECRGIAAAQETYFALNGSYLDVTGTLDNYSPTDDPGNFETNWQAKDGAWAQLDLEMPAYVRYSYATVAGLAGAAWPTLGTTQVPTWPAATKEWYVVQALGDLNGDDNNSLIIVTSFNDHVFQENSGE